MPDPDLLKILDAPEIAVLAHRPQVEARHAKGFRAHLGIPAVEAPEVEIRRAVGQSTRLDRVAIIDQEQEDIAVRGIKRGRVAADFDIGVVDPVDQSSTPGTFQRVSPVPLPAMRCTASTSSKSWMRP